MVRVSFEVRNRVEVTVKFRVRFEVRYRVMIRVRFKVMYRLSLQLGSIWYFLSPRMESFSPSCSI